MGAYEQVRDDVIAQHRAATARADPSPIQEGAAATSAVRPVHVVASSTVAGEGHPQHAAGAAIRRNGARARP